MAGIADGFHNWGREVSQYRFDREDAAKLPGVIHDLGKELEIVATGMRLKNDPEWINELADDIEEIGRQLWAKWRTLHEYMNGALEQIDTRDKNALNREHAIDRARRAAAAKLCSDNIADSFDPHGFFVYLLLDANDTPIYVGQSTNVLSRLGTHMGSSDRRFLTRRVQLIKCTSKIAMNRTEGLLIREHQPMLNVAGL